MRPSAHELPRYNIYITLADLRRYPLWLTDELTEDREAVPYEIAMEEEGELESWISSTPTPRLHAISALATIEFGKARSFPAMAHVHLGVVYAAVLFDEADPSVSNSITFVRSGSQTEAQVIKDLIGMTEKDFMPIRIRIELSKYRLFIDQTILYPLWEARYTATVNGEKRAGVIGTARHVILPDEETTIPLPPLETKDYLFITVILILLGLAGWCLIAGFPS